MARVSRKAQIAQEEANTPLVVERIYNTAIYLRLSVENNQHGDNTDSIDLQRYMLEQYVAAQPDMQLAAAFCDNGATGTNFNRPGFEDMMDAVRERKIDCIVVKDLSRFGRNYVETGYYLEKIFPFLGVRFIALGDCYDTAKDTGGNELVVSLKNIVNGIYAKDISKKSGTALRQKQLNGEFIGAFAPYGYAKSPEDKHKLIPDMDTAPIVRQIFEKKAEGIGNNLIARWLNDEGIPSPAMHHYRQGHYKKRMPTGASAIWQGQMIKLITGNPTYAGHLAQGKTRKSLCDGTPTTVIGKNEWIIVRNTHEPIVDDALFEKVQTVKEEASRQALANRGKYPATENVLKGLVFCGDCGTKMVRYKGVSPNGIVRYTFICRIYAENLAGSGCSSKCVGEPELLETIMREMQTQLQLIDCQERLLKKLQKSSAYKKRMKKLDADITAAEQALTKNQSKRSTLFEDYNDKVLSEQEYSYQKQRYDAAYKMLLEQRDSLVAQRLTYEKTLSPQNAWMQAFRKHEKEKVLTREVLLELVHHIIVTGYNEIEIVWNFRDAYQTLSEYVEGVQI